MYGSIWGAQRHSTISAAGGAAEEVIALRVAASIIAFRVAA